jgi:hypothetical protein
MVKNRKRKTATGSFSEKDNGRSCAVSCAGLMMECQDRHQ